MNCKEAKILLTPALDNELPTTDSARLADHVAQCNGCRLEWNAALKLREGMKSISARSSAKPSLEADTIKALRSTYTRKDSFSNRQLPMLAAAVVLLMFFIGWMTLSPSSQPGVSVVALVRSTSHGGDDNGSDFK